MLPELQEWFDKSPEIVKLWLSSITVFNFVCDRQNESFQNQGRYDGAISKECKSLFAQEYEMLTALRKLIEREREPQPESETTP